MDTDTVPPLVSVAWLSTQVANPDVRVVDLRWTLSAQRAAGPPPPTRQKYAEGHLPGAVFLDLDSDLSRKPGPGRHPLPGVDDFAAVLSRIGVTENTHVVAYDDAGGSIAARLWFMLRLHGHARASVLDGGFPVWRAAGLPVTVEVPRIAPAPLRKLSRDESMLVDRAQVAALLAARGKSGVPRTLLFDARSPERYRGETEPIDARAGHIPGAVNAPVAGNLRSGIMKPPEELRALYASLGVGEAAQVVASCGSGVTACHTLLALAQAELPPGRLYVGSWSDWSSDPATPIATGPEQG
ncbi:MAG TPA: sulfurtransferase [Myxococcales bacterium]|nr:sulfurtransferase [Myxococcales bacterium]